MKLEKLSVFLFTLLLGTSATMSAQNQQAAGRNNSKILIVYFSLYGNQELPANVDAQSGASRYMYNGLLAGNTEVVARMIQEDVGGDLYPVLVEKKYPENYQKVVDMGRNEEKLRSYLPILKNLKSVEQYDTVFVGFPSWWYDMPMAMYTFFDEYDFAGKKIIPFCTSGGSGFLNTIASIQTLESKAVVEKNGFHVYHTRVTGAKPNVTAWLKKIGMMK